MAFYDTAGLRYDSGVYYDGFVPPQPERKRMAKVKLGLDKMTPDQLAAFATTVKTAMTGNANFPAPNPTLTALGTAITTLQTRIAAYNAAVASGDTALADRDAADLALRGALTTLAAYVDNASGGDRTKIESSGMGVRAGNGRIGQLPAVQNVVLEPSTYEGALEASWTPVRGAFSYEVHTSVDPVTASSWAFKDVSNRASIHLNTFTSGAKIWARVRAVGAENVKGPWSDPAGKTVP
jgi:hypothetical protein